MLPVNCVCVMLSVRGKYVWYVMQIFALIKILTKHFANRFDKIFLPLNLGVECEDLASR